MFFSFVPSCLCAFVVFTSYEGDAPFHAHISPMPKQAPWHHGSLADGFVILNEKSHGASLQAAGVVTSMFDQPHYTKPMTQRAKSHPLFNSPCRALLCK